MSHSDSESRVEDALLALQSGRITRRKFTKRLLGAGLSIGAAGSFLAACGGGEETESPAVEEAKGPVTLRFWKFVSENDDPAIQKAIQRWNKENPRIRVRLETFPFADYTGTKLTTAFAGGKGPDIFWVSPGQFLNYVNEGLAAPVDDLVTDIQSDYLEAAIEAVSVEGKIQSLPFEMEPVGLYYRRDFLEQAGIEPPTTWDELIAAAEALTSGKRRGIVIETAPIPFQVFVWYPFLWSAGGFVVNEDSSGSALRTPEAASAFDLWGRLVRSGFAPKKLTAVSADIGPLGRGETAMQVNGFWAIAQMQNEFPDVPFDVVRIPVPTGGEAATVYGGWTQMINSKGAHIAEAREFTKWLWIDNADFAHTWACVQATKFSPRTSVNDGCSDVFEGDPHSVFTNEILPTARAQPRFPDQVVKAVLDGIQAAMFRGTGGEDAAALAADQIDRFLSTYDGAQLRPV